MSNYMVCLTTDDLNDFIEQKGCGYWKAASDSIKWSDYLICTKNKNGTRTSWDGAEDHHRESFLILEINEQKFLKSGDRKIITFDRYAHVDSGSIIEWKGQSPIAYFDEKQLADEIGEGNALLSPLDLNWLSFQDLMDEPEQLELALNIKDAKKALSQYYDVDEDCISITITA